MRQRENTDQLSPDEFDKHVENGTFRLAFVGMSNSGKSFRSQVLQNELGFLWYHVDEEIRKVLGFSNVDELPAWLGYPFHPLYPIREKEYLEIEDNRTRHASMKTDGKNLVFDTTGSVIHLSTATLEVLRGNCLVVHLDAGENALDSMIQRFFETPKPVAWNGNFSMRERETETDALKRCYPTLVRMRLTMYRKLAHINIPATEMHDKSGIETLAVIRNQLSNQ